MRKKWSVSLLIAVTILAQAVLVDAQEETPLTPMESYELTFADLGYSDKSTTKDDSESYSIDLPGNVTFEGGQNYIDLSFNHTVLNTKYPASLAVTLNDNQAGFIPLTADNAEYGQVRLTLLPEWFKPGYNRLTMALRADVPCGEGEQIRFVATLSSDSVLHLEYNQFTRLPALEAYPLPFTEQPFLPEVIYFVLPRNPTATDIATAATISAGLGRFSGGQIKVASASDATLTDEIKSNHHLIVIGQVNENRILSQLNLPLELSALPAEHGVIQEIVSPWNPYKMLLVVTGQSPAGVFKAGAALNRDAHFLGIKSQVAIIEDVLPIEKVEQTEQQMALTFDSLGYSDRVFYGSRMQDTDYYFNMPLSWQIQESPRLTLAFRHTALVDPLVSSLEIRLNNIPVAGTVLDASNTITGIIEAELPASLLQPGRNRLNVQVKMDHPASGGDVCLYLDSQQIWTVVRRDSFIHLAYIRQSLPPDLALFPYPFDTDRNLSDLILVLPESLSTDDQDGLLRLAVALGAMTKGTQLTLRASTADELDENLKAESNLLVVGRPTRNALIRELNDLLPQPFEPDTDLPTPGLDSVILTLDPDRDAGFIQELVSPWNPEQTILVITGMTDQGVSSALAALRTRGRELKGNLAVVEGNQLYSVDTQPLTSIEEEKETPVVKVTPPSFSLLVQVASNWW